TAHAQVRTISIFRRDAAFLEISLFYLMLLFVHVTLDANFDSRPASRYFSIMFPSHIIFVGASNESIKCSDLPGRKRGKISEISVSNLSGGRRKFFYRKTKWKKFKNFFRFVKTTLRQIHGMPCAAYRCRMRKIHAGRLSC